MSRLAFAEPLHKLEPADNRYTLRAPIIFLSPANARFASTEKEKPDGSRSQVQPETNSLWPTRLFDRRRRDAGVRRAGTVRVLARGGGAAHRRLPVHARCRFRRSD